MNPALRSLIPLLFLVPALAGAAGDPGGSTPGGAWAAPADPVLERYGEASARKDWGRAAAIAREALARDAANANYHNLYAYALRNAARPEMDLVFRHYNEALRLDPGHRGAHEYLGEAYLMVGNVAKAKEHLGVLDRLCASGCDERKQLKDAIAAFEAKRR